MNLTQDDYRNILALISNASIKGGDATAVAVLQQKIAKLLEPEEKKDEKKEK